MDPVTIGLDTGKASHVAVAIDMRGVRLGEVTVPATPQACRDFEAWAAGLGPAAAFGIDWTGSYGAGLSRGAAGRGIPRCRCHAPQPPAALSPWQIRQPVPIPKRCSAPPSTAPAGSRAAGPNARGARRQSVPSGRTSNIRTTRPGIMEPRKSEAQARPAAHGQGGRLRCPKRDASEHPIGQRGPVGQSVQVALPLLRTDRRRRDGARRAPAGGLARGPCRQDHARQS